MSLSAEQIPLPRERVSTLAQTCLQRTRPSLGCRTIRRPGEGVEKT